jgi:putative tricarboxylic transport membrane protein
MKGQLDAQAIRVIALLAPHRLSGDLAHIRTAREEGYEVDWVTWRGFYAPGSVADSVYNRWVSTLTTLESSAEWAELRATNRLEPFFLAGPEFEGFVKQQVTSFRTISREIGLIR